jgi:hypothetical protein
VGQSGSQQIHDFNPGIKPSGLFWTQPIPEESVQIDLEHRTARMHLHDWAIPDFTDIFNSAGVTQPPIAPIPSTVSFDVRWRGKAAPTQIRDTTNHFVGQYIDSTATIVWSAEQRSTHFAFTSGEANTTTPISGVIGRERNGAFFQ